ncbi:sporulation protein [Streptomyces sp. NPDC088785]|uniref:sporulation protein n=1 Tax=Streptomyces sp. NPDC088785 TaxID=3365897 RepID=UPI0037FE0199
MVFKRLLGSLGVGGPTVDTVLAPGAAAPGSTLAGQIRLTGGSGDFDVEHLALELVARVETEDSGTGGDGHGGVVFDRFVVGGGFRLTAGAEHTVPFSVPLPWETPVTELYGQGLGVALGVRTELSVAGARDKGDLDPLAVAPLPAQEAVLEAFGRLGFGFRSADLEYGRIGGTGQRLPFYQEIELTPAPRYAHAVDEIEVTFLAAPDGMEVILEAGRRHGHDALTRFTVAHEGLHHHDWNALVDGWVRQLVEHRAAYGAHPAYDPAYDHGYDGGHDHGYEGGDRSGPGVGTAVAAGAAGLAVGVAGGLVAAEVVDEVGDFFEDDEDDEDDEEGEEGEEGED